MFCPWPDPVPLCAHIFGVCFEREATRGPGPAFGVRYQSLPVSERLALALARGPAAVLPGLSRAEGQLGSYSAAEAEEQVWGGAREQRSEKLPGEAEGASLGPYSRGL